MFETRPFFQDFNQFRRTQKVLQNIGFLLGWLGPVPSVWARLQLAIYNHQVVVPRGARHDLGHCLRRVEATFDGELWEKVIAAVPSELKHLLIASIRETMPSNDAIKQAAQSGIPVPGAEVYRGNHLRVA